MRVRPVLAAAAILAMLWAAPRAARAQAAASADASERLDDAFARFRALTESPTARRRPELWNQAASRFEAILRANPAAPRAGEAAYLLGEVYHERYHTFHARGELDRAVAAYRHVLARYPHSAYADDALYQLGEINYYQLGDAWNAYVDYRRITREYPDSDMAPRARIRLATLDQARTTPSVPLPSPGAVVGGSPSAGSPLSSPGAVVGESPKGRRTVILGPTPPRIPEAPRRASRKERRSRRAARLEPPVTEVPRETRPETSALATTPPVAPSPAPTPSAPASSTARPPNPLLEEGSIPLRRPSENLPRLPLSGRL